jgi:hypothetical protein
MWRQYLDLDLDVGFFILKVVLMWVMARFRREGCDWFGNADDDTWTGVLGF